jgi:FkbH-like protein
MSHTNTEGLRLLLIASFNTANLAAILAKDEGLPRIHVVPAPFGQVMKQLLDPAGEALDGQVAGALVWTSPETVSLSYRRLAAGNEAEPEELLSDVDQFCGAIQKIPRTVKHILVPTWAIGPFEARQGVLDMSSRYGVSLALMRMNVRLAENLSTDSRVIVLDAGRWLAVNGERSLSDRLWYMAKTPYTAEFFKIAAMEIKAALAAASGRTRKLIILDLDDTLWGGVVGDVGWENVRLGGHDPIGEAFRDFQAALKTLKVRGVLLGLVSKNDERTALEAIRRHPEMVLRQEDFVAWRINWEDKARNVSEVAAELNLGLDSVVFIDDNPVERARVRQALPEVLVPEWPRTAVAYKAALLRLRCFDKPRLSVEDRQRSEAYAAERERRTAQANAGTFEDWLGGLGIEVTGEPVTSANLDRVEQLLNKTNQMNLSTRRLTKQEIWDWSQRPGNKMLAFRVTDKYGDYGLVAIGSISWPVEDRGDATVVDFVLSCRAMGRKVEETVLHVLSLCARSAGASRLVARYAPTPRNQPCLRFLERAVPSRDSSGILFALELAQAYPKPSEIRLVLSPDSISCAPPRSQGAPERGALLLKGNHA